MPSPKCALRWLWFSPVPSHSTLESRGSMTMQQRLWEPPSSKIGVKDTPRFVVFHTPPNDDAMYQVLGLFGSMAMSEIRPVTRPGPRVRTPMPASVAASMAGRCAAAGTGRAAVRR
jgi:hypothetical protein